MTDKSEITVGDLWEDTPGGLKNFLVYTLQNENSSDQQYKKIEVANLPFVPLKIIFRALKSYSTLADEGFEKISIAMAALEIDKALAKLDKKYSEAISQLRENTEGCL